MIMLYKSPHHQDQHTCYHDHEGHGDLSEEDEGDEGDVDGNYTRAGMSPPISKPITASDLFV